MKVIESITEYQQWRRQHGSKSLGFVPTMGALHEGHGSLLAQSKKDNDISVLSIFVNPTQFNDTNDFLNYPKTWDEDLKMAESHFVDVVFSPKYDELYADQYRFKIQERDFSHMLCGAHRPGHFDGVLTVVAKLLNIIQPTKAYFGEKDFQQLNLIKEMVQHLFIPVEIIACPTLREKSGLAMSSRNKRLTPEHYKIAPHLFSCINSLKTSDECVEKLTEFGFKVDYVVDVDERRFAAAYLGPVRLIDNVKK